MISFFRIAFFLNIYARNYTVPAHGDYIIFDSIICRVKVYLYYNHRENDTEFYWMAHHVSIDDICVFIDDSSMSTWVAISDMNIGKFTYYRDYFGIFLWEILYHKIRNNYFNDFSAQYVSMDAYR